MFTWKRFYLAGMLAPSLVVFALLSTWTMSGGAADAVCDVPGDHATIQAAIDDPACDTVNLTAEATPGPAVYFEHLIISRTVTIQGRGPENTAVDGDEHHDIVFDIRPGSVVTFTDLTIQNGGGSTAGGILNDGVTTLRNCAVRGNRALFAAGINNAGAMIIADCLLENNITAWIGGGAGGAIGNAGTMTITNSSLISNSADLQGGAIGNLGVLRVIGSSFISNTAETGGAIANWTDGVTTLVDTSILSNTATSACCGGDGGGAIWNRTGATMTVQSSTIAGNRATQDDGGAIANQGVLKILDSTLADNRAATGGGALFADAGAVTIEGATFHNNRGLQWDGGAIDNNGATLTITNSTFSGNRAVRNGGAIATDRHSQPNTLANVTIVENTAGGDGGGLYTFAGELSARSSLLANNSAGRGADCYGQFISLDYNLIEDPVHCAVIGVSGHNVTGQDPQLGPLQNNDGPTFTHALLEGSPAIDAGGDSGPQTDQRGVSRPQDGDEDGVALWDIGAFELVRTFFEYLPLVER